jgi:preprotein translocase SecF subunit
MIKLIPDDVNIPFIDHKNKVFFFSLFIVVGSILLFFIKGLNYGIDFRGGYIVEARFPSEPKLQELRRKLAESYDGEFSLQQMGSDKRDLVIKLERAKKPVNLADSNGKDSTPQAQAGATSTDKPAAAGSQPGAAPTESEHVIVINKVKDAIGEGVTYRKVETIGPTVGEELVMNAIKAVLFSLIAIAIYIAFRFEWQFAVCGLIALGQDCIGLIGAYSLFNLEFNATAIIAILTTASYSINDSIVIFDRIRENIKRHRKMPMPTLVNRSINETLSRTILTAGSTLIAVLALCLFGGSVIMAFSLPVFIGLALGTFSSIALSAPLVLLFKIDREKMANKGVNIVRVKAVEE